MQSLPFVQIYDIKNFAADDSEVRITAFLRARTLTRFTEPEGRVIYPTPWSWHSQGFFSSEPSSRYISTAWAPFVNPYGAGIYPHFNHVQEDLLRFAFPSANSMFPLILMIECTHKSDWRSWRSSTPPDFIGRYGVLLTSGYSYYIIQTYTVFLRSSYPIADHVGFVRCCLEVHEAATKGSNSLHKTEITSTVHRQYCKGVIDSRKNGFPPHDSSERLFKGLNICSLEQWRC